MLSSVEEVGMLLASEGDCKVESKRDLTTGWCWCQGLVPLL